MSSEGLIPEYVFDGESNATITGEEAVDKCVQKYFDSNKEFKWLGGKDDNLTAGIERLGIDIEKVAWRAINDGTIVEAVNGAAAAVNLMLAVRIGNSVKRNASASQWIASSGSQSVTIAQGAEGLLLYQP
jgi:hypothetical protein